MAGLDPYRTRLYRLILALAAVYNLAFGAWAGLFPHSFFDLFDLAPPLYPAIWQCLGMVIGVYGLAYGYAALHLEAARPFVALGLLGKVLGPIGWMLTTRSGEWPLRTFTLIAFNDLIWWLPFGLFLLEGTRLGARLRAIAPYACALLNCLAGLALLVVLRPGTEAQPSLALRAAYIAQNSLAWRAGWLLWMAAALSLLGFYAWWGARLPRPAWGLMAAGLAIVGLACDFLAESLYIGWLPDRLAELQRAASLVSGGGANGLYTAAGITLTLASPWLRGPLRWWAWATWLSGLALSVSTVIGFTPGMIASGAALMTLFVPWTAVLGWRLGAARRSRPELLRAGGAPLAR